MVTSRLPFGYLSVTFFFSLFYDYIDKGYRITKLPSHKYIVEKIILYNIFFLKISYIYIL